MFAVPSENVTWLSKARARSAPQTRLRKLLYGLSLCVVYFFLLYLSADHSQFQVFFLACWIVSFLPLIGLLPSLCRSFLVLAAGLLALSVTPADLLQGDFRTLPANMDLTIEVSSQSMPGIEGPQRFTTDAKGFRTGNRVVHYEDDSSYRIFAIGASTTEQTFIDDKRTWTRLLERDLGAVASGPVEVINAGVSGLRLVHNLATQEHVEGLNPDLVLFLIGVNDWNRQVTRHFDRDERFRESSENALKARFKSSIAFAFYQIYIAVPQHSKLVVRDAQFVSMTDRTQRPHVVRYLPDRVSDDFAEGMASLAERCRASAYRCMLLTQPTAYYPEAPDSVSRHFRLTPPGRRYTLDLESLVHISELYNNFLRDFATAEALLLCDLDAVVPKGTQAFYDDVHFNTDGARIVSDVLRRCILEQVRTL